MQPAPLANAVLVADKHDLHRRNGLLRRDCTSVRELAVGRARVPLSTLLSTIEYPVQYQSEYPSGTRRCA